MRNKDSIKAARKNIAVRNFFFSLTTGSYGYDMFETAISLSEFAKREGIDFRVVRLGWSAIEYTITVNKHRIGAALVRGLDD